MNFSINDITEKTPILVGIDLLSIFVLLNYLIFCQGDFDYCKMTNWWIRIKAV